MILNDWGVSIYFDVALQHMDDDIREFIHDHIDHTCTEQEFFNMYCEEHLNKYGEEFFLNEMNPVY